MDKFQTAILVVRGSTRLTMMVCLQGVKCTTLAALVATL
ncbi:hypothetical protein QFZ34_002525 [Phyllobacterium ifriqiyense]|uniref:Uncharacterized protein n=1 Tax=Phyllobacterium ifriqiyense TaxID=314238 RepID=A0ABU0SC66_9HYPH|nr:hypothetical protein [Phyllobacterium ifriqiyense]